MSACKLGVALASTPVRRALESGASADYVAGVAEENLYSVSASTIRGHRRGQCICSDEDETAGPRILTIDLETSPNIAHVWGLFKQTVSLNQLRESTRVIAFAAKWHGEDDVEFRSEFHDGHREMVERAHKLLSDADIVVTYNGVGFDMKHLRREFVLAGMPPTSPWKDVDLLNVVKGQFRFTSNKLDHVAQELGLGAKTSHTGHELWVQCLAGDPDAWDLMREYNIQDVALTERLYDRLLPWIKGHPHLALYTGEEQESCGRCGSTNLRESGAAKTPNSAFPQFQCTDCGSFHRAGRRVAGVNVRPI